MNPLRQVGRKVACARLRREALRDPTPGSVAAAVERLLARGEAAAAAALVEEGLSLFPGHGSLLEMGRMLRREELRATLSELRESLSRRPDPGTYARLADLHRQLGDVLEAEALCEEARRRFPEDDRGYLLLGELRAERFRKTHLARDGSLAIRNLERAAELNPDGRRARALLAELYASVGARERAIEHLEALLHLDPGEAWARMLRDELRALAGPGKDPETLLFEVERRGRTLRQVGSGARKPREALEATARQGIEALRGLRGVRALAVLGEAGVLAEESPEGPAGFGEVAAGLLKAAGTSTRKMDAGEFRRAVFEGSFGRIVLSSARGLVVALHVEGGFQMERLHHQVEETLERLNGAPARAPR